MAREKQDSQIGFTKKRSRQSSEELCFLVPHSTTVSIITIDDDEDETLVSKKTDDHLKIPPSFGSSGSKQSTTVSIITIDDDDEDDETLDSKDKKTDDVMIPPRLNSSTSLPSADAIIIIDDEKDKCETLEPKKKKPRLGSWWDNDDAFDELSIVVKGLPKPKDTEPESRVDSCFSSSTDLQEKKKDGERSSSSTHHVNFIDLSDAESVGSNKGIGHVSLEELGVTVEEQKINSKKRGLGSCCLDVGVFDELSSVVKGLSRVESSCFSSPHEPETKKKKVDERSLSSTHHDKSFIDLSEDKTVAESTKGVRHVSLDEFGVSVEDLKSMPWEAFDPAWEIRSKTMDPWLGGFVQDMLCS
ncbi:unnamed protein product [Microthlaspi erraticum]|uniref:Uncharacterized protein n=1 Tax=Microthlaspi erraticum TaxID=1685480 RepID=A0A6D2JTH7_9BRAS|nr:unnamed protein product [Microthlaspi erraticum]